MKEYTVYILRCNDNSLYIGMTSDLTTRINEHNLGTHIHSFTYSRRPVYCVYSVNFSDVYDAIAWERRIKRWSRSKKEALINNVSRLHNLAKCNNTSHSDYYLIDSVCNSLRGRLISRLRSR